MIRAVAVATANQGGFDRDTLPTQGIARNPVAPQSSRQRLGSEEAGEQTPAGGLVRLQELSHRTQRLRNLSESGGASCSLRFSYENGS